ncbi:hypothetical protein M3Y99_01628400 [Aphelenchoides fujianensis]|nr:hypothetical protein M3Y99_01628400 [Aphelenchoides fujianensis]
MAMLERKRSLLLPAASSISKTRVDFFHFFPCLRPWRLLTLFAVGGMIFLLLSSPKPKDYVDDTLNNMVNTWTNGTSWSDERPSRVDEHLRWVVDNKWIVPPLPQVRAEISSEHCPSSTKINVCAIEKNMSTILTAIICFLFDSARFKAEGRNVNTETFHERMCGFQNELFEFIGDLKNYTVRNDEWLHMTVSRDPIERFISGFVDKCVVEKIYLQDRRIGNSALKYARGDKVKIKFDHQHFFPQNWRCNFRSHLNDFKIVRFEHSREFFVDVFQLFKEQGVAEEDIDFVREQIESGRTTHTTTGREERERVARQVRGSRYLMKKLIEMYYYDFVLLGYEIPELPAE